MRGNHRLWGRQDYEEPNPLSADECAIVAECEVGPMPGRKTWHAVHRHGRLIGYVSTRLAGQMFRTPDMDSWMFAAQEWNRADPPHSHALLALVEASKLRVIRIHTISEKAAQQ